VDPVIAAAWITGGVGAAGIAGTVAATIVGSRNTKHATEAMIAAGAATTAATLAAAREDRLWEKRAAVYEETLTGLLFRQADRFHSVVELDWDEALEPQLKDAANAYDSPQWFERLGRLYAYGSDAVLAASDAAHRAHGEVGDRHHELEQLRELVAEQASALPDTAPEREALGKAGRKLTSAMEAASAAEKELIKVIRDELRSKPEAAVLPVTVPAERHRFWRWTS
jgi:hypothetical protein